MSKIREWTNDHYVALLDCGHLYQIKDDFAWNVGTEVVCPTCADTEKRVKAARREALEWARDIVIAIDVTTDVQGALNAILDKIEEKP